MEQTAVIKYKCVYYYTGPMLYNFTHTRICDLRLLLGTEETLANLPRLTRRPLKMSSLEEAVTERKRGAEKELLTSSTTSPPPKMTAMSKASFVH